MVGAPLDRYPAVNERFSGSEAYYGGGEGRHSYRNKKSKSGKKKKYASDARSHWITFEFGGSTRSLVI